MRTAVAVGWLLLIGFSTPRGNAEDAQTPLPGTARSNIRAIEKLVREEHFDEADDAIKTALESNAQDSDLHRVHGDLLFREGHVFEADAEYKAAFHLNKNNARAIYGVARTFRVSGLRAKAAGLVRAAHELAPGDPEIGAAFNTLDNSASGAVARWEKVLENPEVADNPERKSHVETELATARLLNGKHEFELISPYQPYRLPYRTLYNGKHPTGMGMTIMINGVRTELRVDTGAGGVNVSSGFAAKAGIQRIGNVKMTGIGNQGGVDSWIGYAEKMQIGDLEFRNVIVDVREKGSVGESGGLLGTDIFRRFLVKVNFRESRIDLDLLPGPVWDGYTPVDRYEGPELKEYAQILQVHDHVFMPTVVSEKQKSEQTKCLFLVDTGAGMNNISTNLAPSVTKVRSDDRRKVRGLSGNVKMVYQADQIVLQFANFRQTNLNLIAFDLSSLSRYAGIEVSGILGLPVLSLFRSFTLDYRDARIDFDYKAY